MEERKEIERLQNNLATIRRLAGWTAEQLGEYIGVTKQTVSNLETYKTKMTLTQYIAIRSVLDCEVEDKKNETLKNVIKLLVDTPDEITDEEYEKAQDVSKVISSSVSAGVPIATAGMIMGATLPGLLPTIGLISSGKWIKDILKNNN